MNGVKPFAPRFVFKFALSPFMKIDVIAAELVPMLAVLELPLKVAEADQPVRVLAAPDTVATPLALAAGEAPLSLAVSALCVHGKFLVRPL